MGFNPVDAQKFLEQLGSNQKFNAIPVLVVTEDENITHAHFLVKNGASDILRYPINKYELESRINFALNYFQEFQKVKVPA